MPWKLTVRAGAKVQRSRHDELAAALEEASTWVRELTADARRPAVEVRVRRFEPVQQVAARIEIAGPERLSPSVRGGIDVRGDGSTEAYVGRIRRRPLEPKRGETPLDALRRALRDG